MIKLDRLEELPEWFDLDSYRDCKKFNALDWYNCLTIRRELIGYLQFSSRHGIPVRDVWGSVGEPQILIRRAPLDWRALRSTYWFATEESKSPPDSPVRELEFADLLFQRESDFDDEYEGKDSRKAELWMAFNNHNWTEALEKLEGIAVGCVSGRLETIKVDMAASDAVLITAFSTWLRRARARQPATTNKRERPAYKGWAGYGLLPYLDLMLWSKETGTRISHHTMAEAVGYRKGGDSFRKSVPKLANDLMSSLSELEALAAIEASLEQLVT